MASIRPLPEAVRSSVRSGIFLFDTTRVVEELVFNSLDAGATKVLSANLLLSLIFVFCFVSYILELELLFVLGISVC